MRYWRLNLTSDGSIHLLVAHRAIQHFYHFPSSAIWVISSEATPITLRFLLIVSLYTSWIITFFFKFSALGQAQTIADATPRCWASSFILLYLHVMLYSLDNINVDIDLWCILLLLSRQMLLDWILGDTANLVKSLLVPYNSLCLLVPQNSLCFLITLRACYRGLYFIMNTLTCISGIVRLT